MGQYCQISSGIVVLEAGDPWTLSGIVVLWDSIAKYCKTPNIVVLSSIIWYCGVGSLGPLVREDGCPHALSECQGAAAVVWPDSFYIVLLVHRICQGCCCSLAVVVLLP